MKTWSSFFVIVIVASLVISSGCSQPPAPATPAQVPQPPAPGSPGGTGTITPGDLTLLVRDAVAYARANGKDAAIAAFNDPNGSFVRNGSYIFAEGYDGTALAEPFEHELVGTNVRNMTDRYGVPLVRNLGETAGYGIGFVSYDYPDPADSRIVRPRLAVAGDVDGTWYIGSDTRSASVIVYPSSVIGPATHPYTVDGLTAFVKNATAYARANGKEKALSAFNDPKGPFTDGELYVMALDFNGTVLANGISPQTADNRINLINYHDPDGVRTIREMRDLAKQEGGFSYTVAAVTKDKKTYFAPKIDYAEPVDTSYWIFAGIILPRYEQLREGNLTGVAIRSHTRAEVYDLVNRAAGFARANGSAGAIAEIGKPKGMFANGDLFTWAEGFNGTILADPYWAEGAGTNQMNYTDPYGAKTTVVGINAIRSGTGFTHAVFPDTAQDKTAPIPKLIYMQAVDDQWWIGSGIYGIQVA